ncbi:polysaccharide pyruvyl transferase family protein, partial [Conexibacter stalactiti]
MESVLLAGAFGQRNPGDDALLDAFVRELPGWRCVATSCEPARTRARHGVGAVQSRDPLAVVRTLLRCDALVIAGGTVFKTLPASTGRPPRALLRNALALTLLARMRGRPVALLGVGAGRLDDPGAQRLARTLVRSADLLVVRDEESAETLAAIGAPAPFRVGADAAWGLLDPLPGPRDARRDSGDAIRGDAIVVALGRHGGGSDLVARLADALAAVAGGSPVADRGAVGADRRAVDADRGVLVRIQPWQVGDDAAGQDDELHAHVLATALRRRGCRAEVVPPPASLPDARDLVVGARLVVATRFHATVVAAAAGVPFLALAHEQKLAGLARRLGQPAVRADAPAPELARALADALAQP